MMADESLPGGMIAGGMLADGILEFVELTQALGLVLVLILES